MRILHAETYEKMSKIGADFICETIRKNPKTVLCLATGATPKGMYHDVVNRCHQEQIRTNEIKCIKLDEWYRLPMDHPSTCEYYLQKEFIDPLHLREDQVIGFNSDAIDPFQECLRIENLIQDISIDICILGLGSNGHLGLNEPADHLDLDIHVASLKPSSQKHSMLENVKVKTGMTLGMGAIFSSKPKFPKFCN
jgi:galactosamine-6-phosphate isomerase